MSECGLGYLPDVADSRDAALSVSALGLGVEPLAAVDYRHKVPKILNQSRLPSCVAQAVPQAILLRERILNIYDTELTSRFFCWWYSRRLHDAHKQVSGTHIRYAFKALKALGRPPESAWPQRIDDAYAVKKPPPNITVAAYPKRAASYHRVSGTGQFLKTEIRRALSAGMPVVFGTTVAQSFLDRNGPQTHVGIPQDDYAGGHAMCIVGYDDDGAWVCNSWGSDWRAGGFVHLLWEYILWYETRDLWAVDLMPEETG
jgi:C1A family cysteine protease